jgi:DNA-binding NarL/FixJ family response regulator
MIISALKPSALVVDDHKMVCDGITALVKSTSLVNKAFSAYGATDALHLLKNHHITVIFVDARMPGFSGIELMQTIRRDHPLVKIIGMTSFDEDGTIKEIMNANVNGILLKRSTGAVEIKLALEHVLNNQTYFTPEVEKRFKTLALTGNGMPKLTQRENEIVRLLSKGHSTKEIARMLDLSPSTIEDYRKNLLEKLGVKNVAELVAHIHLNGLV